MENKNCFESLAETLLTDNSLEVSPIKKRKNQTLYVGTNENSLFNTGTKETLTINSTSVFNANTSILESTCAASSLSTLSTNQSNSLYTSTADNNERDHCNLDCMEDDGDDDPFSDVWFYPLKPPATAGFWKIPFF
jgi:hypothetical protein